MDTHIEDIVAEGGGPSQRQTRYPCRMRRYPYDREGLWHDHPT